MTDVERGSVSRYAYAAARELDRCSVTRRACHIGHEAPNFLLGYPHSAADTDHANAATIDLAAQRAYAASQTFGGDLQGMQLRRDAW